MKKHFTEQQIRDLIYEKDDGTFEIVNHESGENRRWSAIQTYVVKEVSTGKLYEIFYDRGLTESQDDTFVDQDAPEVIEYEETIIVKKYKKVEE